jgi:hypothetical protein
MKTIEQSAKEFIRVGDDYFKITHRPDKNGNLHRVLSKRKKGTITDDFGNKILGSIPKYEDFVMVPSHVNYQEVIHGHYNKYYKLDHKPKPGSCNHIISYLTHVFGEKYLDFILDYFQLLYLKPTQNLPVILLESFKKNTGKSTFGILATKIFQFNSVSVGNKDLQSDFNSVWMDKLLIILDETSLDGKEVMQTIKRLSTEKGQVLSNSKGKDKVGIDFIGKFIFMSNHEGTALPIERGEKRFAVFKVPTFEEKGIKDDTGLLSKMEAEIPAFLNFLQGRELVHEEKSRMHFDFSVYETEQLNVYLNGAGTYTTKAIKELVSQTFEMFPDENELRFSATHIFSELTKGNFTKAVDRQQIKKAIEQELSIPLQKKGRFTYFSLFQAETQESSFYYPTPNGENNAHYIFQRKDFANEGDSEKNTILPLYELEQMAIL